jgi:hypothetical protein
MTAGGGDARAVAAAQIAGAIEDCIFRLLRFTVRRHFIPASILIVDRQGWSSRAPPLVIDGECDRSLNP